MAKTFKKGDTVFQVGDKISFIKKKEKIWGRIVYIGDKDMKIKGCYPKKNVFFLEKKTIDSESFKIEKHEIGEPEPESCHVDEKDCEIEKIEGELNGKKDDVKRLNQLYQFELCFDVDCI